MRILKILILILLLLFPFGELLRFRLTDTIVLKPLDITAGLITINVFILYFKGIIRLQSSKWYFIAFPVVGLISLILNSLWVPPSDLFTAFLYLIRWVSYAAVCIAIVTLDKNFKNKITTILIIDGLIIVTLGFLQYFFYQSLVPLLDFGWDDHMYRMFSVFFDPNFAGGFFSLYLFFVVGLIFTLIKHPKETISSIPFANISKNKQLSILVTIAILTLIAILLTFSRSALLMFICGSILFLVLIKQKKLILLLFLGLAIFILSISSKFYIENINLFREASSTARLQNYGSAWQIIQDRPIFGVGFNTYRYAKESYGIPMKWVDRPSHADAGVDNSFLFIVATTGLIGLIVYGAMWYGILTRAMRVYKVNVFALVLLPSAFGLFIHAMFVNSLFYTAIVLWMWFIVGLMWNKK